MDMLERLKTLSSQDRKSVLESEAIAVEEGKYIKPLGPEELAFYKDQLADKSIQQATILDELQTVKDEFKARLEPVKNDIKKSLDAVKYKSIECDGKLYKLADFDEQMIHKVDELGNVITSRKMLPEERQFRIQILKEAANA
jgi:hypothetical protein